MPATGRFWPADVYTLRRSSCYARASKPGSGCNSQPWRYFVEVFHQGAGAHAVPALQRRQLLRSLA